MRARLVLIPLALSAALIAGCANQGSDPAPTPTPTPSDNGVAALSAEEIHTKAKEALGKAEAFQVKGSVESEGQKITVDLRVSGEDAAGTLDVGNMKFEVMGIGNDGYLRADDALQALLAGQPALQAIVKGKWLKFSMDDERFGNFAKEFAKVKDPNEILKYKGPITKGETKTINGTPAIGIVDADKSTLYVATVGEPLPLQIENADGSVTTFTYDPNVKVTPPAASETVDASLLEKS